MPPVKYPLGLSAKKNWAMDILERFRKAKAVLTEKGWVCKENLDLTNLELVALPTILEVGGHFWCNHNQLTTLEGAPKKVGGNFWCNYNRLTTLEGSPEKVGGEFSCSNNRLTTLGGAPETVGGYFSCENNQLTTLEGAPEKVGGKFYCDNNRLPPNKTVEQLLKDARDPKR